MFTGIVEEVGEVTGVTRGADVVALTVRGPTVVADARRGDSIAVNGVCLTVTTTAADTFVVELVPETLRRSSLAAVGVGTRVNLERALPAGGRLGGHIVQGHVDGVGTLLSRSPGERTDELWFALPAGLGRYVVEKGSIAVDGVSLTVAALADGDTGGDTDAAAGPRFAVALIPTTLSDTTLGMRQAGDTVNLEVDVVAKYVERLAAGYLERA